MKLLIVDDQPDFRDYLAIILVEDMGHEVTAVSSGEAALAFSEEQLVQFEVALIDRLMPGINGLELGKLLKQKLPQLVTIMLTDFPSIDTVVQALKEFHFDDYLPKKELGEAEGIRHLKEALVKAQKWIVAHQTLAQEYQLSQTYRQQSLKVARPLVGGSSAMQSIQRWIEEVAPSNSAVLVTGETGTGKELVAQEIHNHSRRSTNPFIPINCNAIPKELLESELFGHRKGAFTGALTNKPGLFQLAHRGTLFLDEIGDLPWELQAKLLRVLQEQQFFPIGSTDLVKADVRIISATNQDLKTKMYQNQFRKDLFYRLNTIQIQIPPLRERPEDIETLANYFLISKDHSGAPKTLLPETVACLNAWNWEGNVRELEHVIERALIVAKGTLLTPDDLPEEITTRSQKFQQVYVPSSRVKKVQTNKSVAHSLSVENPELIWRAFVENGHRLWSIKHLEQTRNVLRSLLIGSHYLKKGHFARLCSARQEEFNVELEFINLLTATKEPLIIKFIISPSNVPFDMTSEGAQTNHSIVIQPVKRGLPDTYLFNLLYPAPKRNEVHGPQLHQMARSVILRYARLPSSPKTLKSVFQQTMTFLIDSDLQKMIKGLDKDGLEATRAYLTGESQIFYGVSQKLKKMPEWVAYEIQQTFPNYEVS